MMQFGGDFQVIKIFIEFDFTATKFVIVDDTPVVLNAHCSV